MYLVFVFAVGFCWADRDGRRPEGLVDSGTTPEPATSDI